MTASSSADSHPITAQPSRRDSSGPRGAARRAHTAKLLQILGDEAA